MPTAPDSCVTRTDSAAEPLHRGQELQRLQSRVVANVSHEFRTRLNPIIGLSKLLLAGTDGELNEEQKKQVGFILRSSESLVELVNDLLDLSKIEAGKAGLRSETFTVAVLFAALRGMFLPRQAGADVLLSFEDRCDVGDLESDQGKISQILENLIANALKFTEHGSVRVSASASPDGRVSFGVADTGIGIPLDDQERVFEEFTQIDNPLQRRTRGNGLGLSLSRRLAELLGGTLTLVSVPGAGSTFTLTVPRVIVQTSQNPADEEPEATGA